MRIASIAAAIATSAITAIASGQGIPASSLSKSPGSGVSRVASRFHQLPPGAYVIAYGGQRVDAAVGAQAQGVVVSFAGLSYTGAIAPGTNHFASTQMVRSQPAFEGDLSDDGVMSGRYLIADSHGVPRAPIAFTLTLKGAGPTINVGGAPQGMATSAAAQHELNPQPLPPKPDWGTHPGTRNSLNPQPLPPEPNWGTRQTGAVAR